MNFRSDSTTKPRRLHTVLVLEDDVLIRMPICQYLRDCGYCVLEAANGDEAAIILQKPDIHIDVVLSDIDMPGKMNGFSFAQWARSVRPGVDIVLAGTPERAAHAAGKLCADGPMLIKPYDHQIVLDRIKRLLAARAREAGS
jgi:DNA-binding response OmpR family regulator